MSMAIGSERDKARLGRNNMDSASSMRHSSRGAACAPSSDVIKSPGRSDSGFGTSWHSPNSTHSFQELSVNFDETHCKEGNGYNIWGGGAINLNMLPQLSSRDVLEDKENELDWSVCELFALCGECPLEDNCCFIHPKRD
ncbi:unnamed protein product [Toxocara canis]|uniref:C3H1-type domain-containing protein n=1 Tax=Toxocara canis TaxID=6265 RepID=A0A183V1E0_TOXCA|nr:unnamed protein product [Toxocara canis]